VCNRGGDDNDDEYNDYEHDYGHDYNHIRRYNYYIVTTTSLVRENKAVIDRTFRPRCCQLLSVPEK